MNAHSHLGTFARGIIAGAALLLIAGCSALSGSTRDSSDRPRVQVEVSPTPPPPASPPSASQPPANLADIPDAVPKVEPRSLRGNPPWYEVFGKRYYVLPTSEGYRERGIASWYGPDFHTKATSSGEPYDMYAMTAAHKTLPLPAYARVTNLSNGRSVVVRINDRGPFVANRIIDLSYTAAHKLDMTRAGTALVEVQVLTPGTLTNTAQNVAATQTVPALSPTAVYLQAGAFSVSANATQLADRLRSNGFTDVQVLPPDATAPLHRVRIGPIADVAALDQTAARLTQLGVEAHLVTP
ncbi:MAG: septal ring lytic transglycosylase RlpA family protein [Nevskiaceae bacterium]|jgi:rare lipoprotein A|nr:septal ring lytic transglycosylase RlpA family protein [Nevskiaceae bacterium]